MRCKKCSWASKGKILKCEHNPSDVIVLLEQRLNRILSGLPQEFLHCLSLTLASSQLPFTLKEPWTSDSPWALTTLLITSLPLFKASASGSWHHLPSPAYTALPQLQDSLWETSSQQGRQLFLRHLLFASFHKQGIWLDIWKKIS